jgi:DNA-binding IclR family transcriptional regulator
MQYSEIQADLGLGVSATRALLSQMVSEGFIAMDENMQISIRLSGHSIMTLFPKLF